MFSSDICELLNIKYPIIQGAMAWIADSTLASSVSNAGGLGIIAAGNNTATNVRAEIRRAKELTDKPFGVNIMLLSPNADDIARLVCEEGVKVVTTGAGNPGKYMDMWKENGIKVIPIVASTSLAKRMEKSGADMIIAEGCEAGGHIGELTTMALLPQVVEAVNIPVIAAGGIVDSRSVAATMALGAKGFQVGTRFLAAKECRVHTSYKEKIINSKDIDSIVTGRSTGHPVRGLKNKFSRNFLKLENSGVSKEEIEKIGSGALKKAAVDGDVDNGSIMAGQVAALVKKEESCEEIIKDLVGNVEVLLKDLINRF